MAQIALSSIRPIKFVNSPNQIRQFAQSNSSIRPIKFVNSPNQIRQFALCYTAVTIFLLKKNLKNAGRIDFWATGRIDGWANCQRELTSGRNDPTPAIRHSDKKTTISSKINIFLHFMQFLSAFYATSLATLYILHLVLALNRCVFVAKSTYCAINSATIVVNNDENTVPKIERHAFIVSSQ